MEGLKERNSNLVRASRRAEKSKPTSISNAESSSPQSAQHQNESESFPPTKPKVGLDEEEMLFLARRCLAEELMTRPNVPSVLTESNLVAFPSQVSPLHGQPAAMLLPQWTIVHQQPAAVLPDRVYHPHHVPVVAVNQPPPIEVPPVQQVRPVVAAGPMENARRNNRLFQLHRLGVGLVILKFGWVWVSCGGLILADSVFCTGDIFVLIFKRLKEHVFQVGNRISASARDTVKLFTE